MRLMHRLRAGTTLVEFLLFLGILTFVGSALTYMLLATEDARVRQGSIGEFEQHGARIVQLFTRSIDHAEDVLDPPAAHTGSILTLQMNAESEYATVFAATASGNLLFIQKDTGSLLLPEAITMTNLVFRNVAGVSAKSATFSFDLTMTIPLPQRIVYTKHFEGGTTLPQDNDLQSGGCFTCPSPACVSHDYHWPYCSDGVCRTGSGSIAC